jgi:SAM-dependent methyltransferase
VSWFETAFGSRYLELYAHRDAQEAARALTSLFGPGDLDGLRVLDLACGAGRYVRELRRRGASAVGLDLSSALLAEARRVGTGEGLLRADMRRIPLRDGTVDVTLSMFTSFGYFDTLEEHARLAREMARVTRSDIVVDVPNPPVLRRSLVEESERSVGERRVFERRWIESDPLRVCKRIEIEAPPDQKTGRETYEERVLLFSRSELEGLFRDAGFVAVTVLGDYDGRVFDASDSSRVIARFTRNRKRAA